LGKEHPGFGAKIRRGRKILGAGKFLGIREFSGKSGKILAKRKDNPGI
jgi:hypothetical protein